MQGLLRPLLPKAIDKAMFTKLWFLGLVLFSATLVSCTVTIAEQLEMREPLDQPTQASEKLESNEEMTADSEKIHVLAEISVPSDDLNLFDRTVTLWYPHLEWNLANPSYSGNPFDLIASVIFTHQESGRTHQTEMYYDGDSIWRFRFTGTLIGEWTYTTTSSDPDLHGHSGTISVSPNPDPRITGFLVSHENKFALQVGNENELQAYLFNVYMNENSFRTNGEPYGEHLGDWQGTAEARTLAYCDEAFAHGFDTIFINVNNEWFELGSNKHTTHSSEDPDLETFAVLDTIVTVAHGQGCRVHFWAWGDEDRQWTPIGVGGINGTPDRRIQRYIAARLGPLPGWSMGYGFDLFEWVSAEQVAAWGNHLKEHMGWEHLLMAREERSFLTPDNMDVLSNDDRPTSGFYNFAVDRLSENPTRPVLFSRRFLHTRDNVWTMETTRRALWQFTMAGGAGGWWGPMWNNGPPYPNPEQLVTHREFWQGRFLLDMVPANELTNGYALKEPSNLCYVFYKENSATVQMDLSAMSSAQPAVAVDTRLAYAGIDLGMLSPGNHTWNAPYQSDWAIAVGNFNRQAAVASDFQTEPLNQSNNAYLPLITGGVATDSCGY
jgi:hypothetical protein